MKETIKKITNIQGKILCGYRYPGYYWHYYQRYCLVFRYNVSASLACNAPVELDCGEPVQCSCSWLLAGFRSVLALLSAFQKQSNYQ